MERWVSVREPIRVVVQGGKGWRRFRVVLIWTRHMSLTTSLLVGMGSRSTACPEQSTTTESVPNLLMLLVSLDVAVVPSASLV